MKSNIFAVLLVFLFTVFSFAQGNSADKKEQIQALKISFITNELSLTTDEAALFWPIYNAYDDKQFDLRHKKMKSFIEKINDPALDKMTDKEATNLLAQIEHNEEEVYQLRKRFMASIKGVLSPVKIIKLKKAEVDFNRKLLKQYKSQATKKD